MRILGEIALGAIVVIGLVAAVGIDIVVGFIRDLIRHGDHD